MNVAIIGSNGQLGTALTEFYSKHSKVFPLTHSDIEISDYNSIINCLKLLKVDLVLNTAAYHNVPKCEINVLKSYEINAVAALNLARASNELDFKLLQYSTDYVFNGEKNSPYSEEDSPNPLNIYAESKLSGENLIKNYCKKHFIVRISGIYGKVPCRAKGGNFVSTMIRLANEKEKVSVVTDEILTPTPVTEIAMNSFYLSNTDSYGLYHMSSQGECSWYDFAKVIFDELKFQTPLLKSRVSDSPPAIKRPAYSVLENKALNRIHLDKMSHWKISLITFLNEISI